MGTVPIIIQNFICCQWGYFWELFFFQTDHLEKMGKNVIKKQLYSINLTCNVMWRDMVTREHTTISNDIKITTNNYILEQKFNMVVIKNISSYYNSSQKPVLIALKLCMNIYRRRVWRYQRVIRIRKSKKDRQHNGRKKKDKSRTTNTDLQNIHIKQKIEQHELH